jgi:ethanolamine permease
MEKPSNVSLKPSSKDVSEKTEEDAYRRLGISWFQIWMLGITIVIGGQYFSWNVGLEAGFGSFIISVILIGLAYVLMCLGNAELTSAIPFAGGAYGLARLTLGFYPGFIVGICESMEYIVYVASSAISLSQMIAQLTNTSQDMVPLYCFVFYVIAVALNILGGRAFWWTSTALGMVSLGIVVVYCLGGLPWVSMSRNAPTPQVTGSDDFTVPNQWFIGDMGMFMRVLPLAPWFFVGVESLNLCSSIVKNVSVCLVRRHVLHPDGSLLL